MGRGLTKLFHSEHDLLCHFAKFGIQCIPDNTSSDALSKEDRLSVEVYFATPKMATVNTL